MDTFELVKMHDKQRVREILLSQSSVELLSVSKSGQAALPPRLGCLISDTGVDRRQSLELGIPD